MLNGMTTRAPRRIPAEVSQDLAAAPSKKASRKARGLRQGLERQIVSTGLEAGTVTSDEVELFGSLFGDLIDALVFEQGTSE